MKRLTEKVYCGYDVANRKLENDYTDEEIFKALQKLGRLEDIEEEIGIDLITLFKVLKEGKLYVSKGYCTEAGETYDLNNYFEINTISYDETTKEELEECSWYKGYENSWKIIFYVYEDYESFLYLVNVKDYGKTWALTKEELENE